MLLLCVEDVYVEQDHSVEFKLPAAPMYMNGAIGASVFESSVDYDCQSSTSAQTSPNQPEQQSSSSTLDFVISPQTPGAVNAVLDQPSSVERRYFVL